MKKLTKLISKKKIIKLKNKVLKSKKKLIISLNKLTKLKKKFKKSKNQLKFNNIINIQKIEDEIITIKQSIKLKKFKKLKNLIKLIKLIKLKKLTSKNKLKKIEKLLIIKKLKEIEKLKKSIKKLIKSNYNRFLINEINQQKKSIIKKNIILDNLALKDRLKKKYYTILKILLKIRKKKKFTLKFINKFLKNFFKNQFKQIKLFKLIKFKQINKFKNKQLKIKNYQIKTLKKKIRQKKKHIRQLKIYKNKIRQPKIYQNDDNYDDIRDLILRGNSIEWLVEKLEKEFLLLEKTMKKRKQKFLNYTRINFLKKHIIIKQNYNNKKRLFRKIHFNKKIFLLNLKKKKFNNKTNKNKI